MNATEQRQIKSALDRIVDRTPDLGPTPDDLMLHQPEPRSNWRPLIAVAAATVVLVGVGVLAANRQSPADNAVAPATQPEQTESSQPVPDVAATDTVLLAPAALPDGYVLYSASNRVDTNPLEGNDDHILRTTRRTPRSDRRSGCRHRCRRHPVWICGGPDHHLERTAVLYRQTRRRKATPLEHR